MGPGERKNNLNPIIGSKVPMNTLPMRLAEADRIGNSRVSFVRRDGRVEYFFNLEPFDFHADDQREGRLLRIAKFAESGVRRSDQIEALGVIRSTVQRAVNQHRRDGGAGFFAPRRGRGPSVIDAAMARTVNRLLASALSDAAVARELGISSQTLNSNRRAGVVGGGMPARAAKVQSDPEAPAERKVRREAPEREALEKPIDRSARDAHDLEAPIGRGARDTTGRMLAATGHQSENRPQFAEPLLAVVGGGVLAGLPMLLKEGLFDRVREFLSLRKGYYGLTTVLLFLAFLVLARVRNPEALRHQVPGEWGAILGLDRCPEVKALRGEIKALGQDVQRVRNWAILPGGGMA